MKTDSALPFFVVGVGASAGGLEALTEFFSEIPADCGVAFLVAQHLSPDFESMMVPLLARATEVEVVEAENGTPVAPNRVYLLPPKFELRLENGRLALSDRPRVQRHTLPIDVLFRSIATEQAAQCAAVVLSGTGSDGSRGIEAIKTAGGLVFVQEPTTAKFDGMPRSAIATGITDYVSPPVELAAQIIREATEPMLRGKVPAGERVAFDDIIDTLHTQTGVDFASYKRATVIRRLKRRMHAHGMARFASYVNHLKGSPQEVDVLRDEMLIGVTRFRRDQDAWDIFRDRVLPATLSGLPDGGTLRAWCAGCSTGQEPYTLAMHIDDAITRSGRPLKYRIFATDISAQAIARASVGEFDEKECADLRHESIEQYFVQRDGRYSVRRNVRDRITFAVHNVLADPPFTRLHMLVCRNLLIYFQPQAQQEAISRFSFSLEPNGVLFLGPSETITADLPFDVLDSKWKLYQRREDAPRRAPRLTSPFRPRTMISKRIAPEPTPSVNLYEAVVAKYVPPGFAIDRHMQVVHYFGEVSRFLNLAPGPASSTLSKIIAAPTSSVVSSAARRALEEQTEVRMSHVRIGELTVDLRVVPNDELLLVFFEHERAPAPDEAIEINLDDETAAQLLQLEGEVVAMREQLHTAVQELETSNEELQATNEELTAANEELQSTNEELQSVNEELYTVNSEYHAKIEELEQLNTDLENVLQSTRSGVLIVDNELKIRRYNGAARGLFPLIDQDVGRSLDHIAIRTRQEGVQHGIENVLKTKAPFSVEIVGLDGRIWDLVARPLGADDGVIVSMSDVSELKKRAVGRLERMVSALSVAERQTKTAYSVIDVDSGVADHTANARRVLCMPEDEISDVASELGVIGSTGALQSMFEKLRNEPNGQRQHSVPRFNGDGTLVPATIHATLGAVSGQRFVVLAYQVTK